jgi:hypothetical protein
MGLISGLAHKLTGSVDVSAGQSAVQPSAPAISPRQSQLAKFYATLPVSFPVCGYTVRIERHDNSLSIHVSQEQIGERLPDIFGRTISATREEVRQFLHFYIKSAVGPSMFTFGRSGYRNRIRLQTVNESLDAWRAINGKRDKHGRLKQSVICICYTTSTDRSRCANRTKDPLGLCHVHKNPDALTLWNHECFSARDAAYELLVQMANYFENQAGDISEEHTSQRLSNDAWGEKWRPIVSTIRYTATDRQIFYLLELGANPNDLQGIDRDRAHALIEQLLEDHESDE